MPSIARVGWTAAPAFERSQFARRGTADVLCDHTVAGGGYTATADAAHAGFGRGRGSAIHRKPTSCRIC